MTLVASSASYVLDAFRIPHRIDGEAPAAATGRITGRHAGELLWIAPEASVPRGWHHLGEIPVYGAVAEEDRVRHALEESERDWHESDAVLDDDGARVGHVWRAADGSALVPFDPDALVRALLREEYVPAGAATSFARRAYYRVRPGIPRRLQLAARRRFARVQERARFPSWPAESALHDLYAYVLGLVQEASGEPLPWIAPWPAGHTWAVVLTHDVEREAGLAHVAAIAALEREHEVRSAWYLVPERDYAVDGAFVRSLSDDGFEIGVHGLKHDGADLTPGTFEERLPAMQEYAEQWGAVGFRAPATHRDWSRMARLGFDYDTSYSDVARYEPQPGGSCSWLPFFIGDVVELPITLPMDHTIFDLLGHPDGGAWLQKAAFLRERSGLALLLTHPDYLLDPARLAEYGRFVSHVAHDSEAWLALPREVSSWWRRRAASSLVREGETWRVVGPAAGEARVEVGTSAL